MVQPPLWYQPLPRLSAWGLVKTGFWLSLGLMAGPVIVGFVLFWIAVIVNWMVYLAGA